MTGESLGFAGQWPRESQFFHLIIYSRFQVQQYKQFPGNTDYNFQVPRIKVCNKAKLKRRKSLYMCLFPYWSIGVHILYISYHYQLNHHNNYSISFLSYITSPIYVRKVQSDPPNNVSRNPHSQYDCIHACMFPYSFHEKGSDSGILCTNHPYIPYTHLS